VEYKLIYCSKYFVRKHATTTKRIRTFPFFHQGCSKQEWNDIIFSYRWNMPLVDFNETFSLCHSIVTTLLSLNR